MDFISTLQLNLFKQADFEQVPNMEDKSSEAYLSIQARNSLRLLMTGWPKSWHTLFSWTLVKALCFKRNPALLRALRRAFQEGFDYLFSDLKEKELTPNDKKQIQLFISNCLAVLPIFDLTPYEAIRIPQFVEERLEQVDYSIHPIELTPTQGLAGFFIRDNDRTFAYGLEPIYQKNAPPHLIFMGTTYPAGQGFIPQVASDLKGFDFVGGTLYRQGRPLILQWLARQNQKAHVCGISLGGAMALLLAIDVGHLVTRVDVLNPPGLHNFWFKNSLDHWDEISDKPHVVIQQQGNDPVSSFGLWKNDWTILQVNPPKNKQGPNAFCDHFMNYAGIAGTHFISKSPVEYNLQRRHRNFWFFSLARFCFYYSAILPIRYLFLPSVYFFADYGINVPRGTWNTLVTLYQLFRGVQQPLLPARLHALDGLRDDAMDLYNPNYTQKMQLTGNELNLYYWIIRCVVLRKPYLPNVELPTKHSEEFTSKRELLQSCQPNAQKTITYEATRAKAVHIDSIVRLVREIGFYKSKELKAAADENYVNYVNASRKFN